MDKAELVGKSDLEIEGRILEALSRARIPVTLCDWNFVPQLAEWQLVIATPWYDTKGPRETYTLLVSALSDASIYQEAPMRRIVLKSPNDSLVKTLERELKFPREGSIHLVGKHHYSVIFAPYTGSDGAVPSRQLTGDDELHDFLEKRLGISSFAVTEAMSELKRNGSSSIFNVVLTARKAKKLGLA